MGVGAHGPLPHPRLGDRPPVDHVQHGVEQQQEPGAAGVDHAGLGQDGQELGRLVERHLAGVAGGLEHGDQAGVAVVGHEGLGRLGGLAHDREDRALDRPHDRLVGGVGGGPQRPGQGGPVGPPSSPITDTSPRSTWDRMTPELPPGPHERPLG